MQTQSLDLVAKLLANENIHVVRAPVATAAFDIVARTLILPQWREMTVEIDQVLVAHEVGHALFTAVQYNEAIESDPRLKFRGAKSYLNILEDVRIEKLMKRRYPGLRKTFNVGYKALNDMDFFQIKGKNLQESHLLDKININFKVGFGVVQFNDEEKQFVERADHLETIEETIQLAADIQAYVKEQEEKQKQAQQEAAAAQPDEVENGDVIPEADDEDTGHSFKDLVEEDNDDFQEEQESESDDMSSPDDEDINDLMGDGDTEETEEEATAESAEQSADAEESESEGEPSTDSTVSDLESELTEGEAPSDEADEGGDEPTTNSSFEDRVAELADTSTEYRYFELDTVKFDPLVPYREVISKVESLYNPLGPESLNKVRTFKTDTRNNVDYLVKEFEMRKAATAYKRTQVAKSGSLDMRKIWSYKLNDDLFKRVTSVKEGKNHGMVFLLDWSGSMDRVLNDTIDQVINLVMFCQRAGIAFQVLAFTDHYDTESMKQYRELLRRRRDAGEDIYQNNGKIDVSVSRFSLLELFSNKMNTTDFNTMINLLKVGRVQRAFPLNGTPLNESLVWMYNYIGQFQKQNNAEKISFITLTDGQGASLPVYFDQMTYGSNGERRKVRNFIKDPVTKKNIEIDRISSGQTNTLIQMIKSRYNCTVLGFYITRNNRQDLADAVRSHYTAADNMQTYQTVERMKSEFRTNGYASLMDTGRDELFIVPTTSTKVQYEALEVDSDASARSIASKFGKYMSTKKTSRILLNKFIGYVA